jgi:hypothetical protein
MIGGSKARLNPGCSMRLMYFLRIASRPGSSSALIALQTSSLEARKGELEGVLTEAAEPPPLLHPEMATFYREQVSASHSATGGSGASAKAKNERPRKRIECWGGTAMFTGGLRFLSMG